jgi:hypothetical protein
VRAARASGKLAIEGSRTAISRAAALGAKVGAPHEIHGQGHDDAGTPHRLHHFARWLRGR